MSDEEATVYLTFDDGPHPEATPYVLDVLQKHGIKATFFLLGKNAERYPDLVQRIRTEGHAVGNHGMNHLNGWTTGLEDYLKDVEEGKKATGSSLFRPPYGRLGLKQYWKLNETETVVFWDVISGDFDQNITSEAVLMNVVDNVRNGSIIVMHDSQKAFNNLKSSLNEVITQLSEKGYRFSTIEAQ